MAAEAASSGHFIWLEWTRHKVPCSYGMDSRHPGAHGRFLRFSQVMSYEELNPKYITT